MLLSSLWSDQVRLGPRERWASEENLGTWDKEVHRDNRGFLERRVSRAMKDPLGPPEHQEHQAMGGPKVKLEILGILAKLGFQV